MTPGLDTSVVVRLLLHEPPELAEAARRFVDEAARDPQGPATISDLVVGETYFVLLHHYAVPHADAVRALHTLLADARLRPSGAAREVLKDLSAMPRQASKGAGLMGRLIHGDLSPRRCANDHVRSRCGPAPSATLLRP